MSATRVRSAVDQALLVGGTPDPGRLALVTNPGAPGGSLTRPECESRTGEIAGRLVALADELRAGHFVVEVGNDNTTASLLLLIAAFRTDVPVFVRNQLAADDEQAAVRDELLRAGVSIISAVPGDGGNSRFDITRSPVEAGSALAAPLPPAVVVLATGGTAGRPKLVLDTALRRSGAASRASRVTSRLNWTVGQTQLVPGRLHHAASLTFFYHGLLDGNCLIVPRRFVAAAAVQLIAEQRVNWLQATPVQLERMASSSGFARASTDSLRGVLHMSASCPASVKRAWIDRIGAQRVFEIYGATEGIGVTIARGDEWLARPGTVGRGFLTQLRILDDQMTPRRPMESGLVFMRSLGRSSSAYLRHSADLRVSPDGFRSVGDHGYLDKDGFLYLEPRRTDLISVGGENVYPAEVERVLGRFPAIAGAAVAAVPDERLGSRPLALVTCWPGMEPGEQEIIAFCREHLSSFKVPRKIIVVTEIPHTPAGKIDRNRLARMVAELPA
jgi:bile acid-coenzyme A ligase